MITQDYLIRMIQEIISLIAVSYTHLRLSAAYPQFRSEAYAEV